MWLWHWAWVNGVPGNLVASIIWGGAAFSAGVVIGKRKIRPHLKKLNEVHELLQHVHPEAARELGHVKSEN